MKEKYKKQLDLVRQNPNLLDNYRFDKDAVSSNHFVRLQLNIAIYNNFKSSDFEIAKFLFVEESKWRKNAKDGEVDNLYFSAFVLTQFKRTEIVWLFFETKNIDFDSGIGFDGEYLVAAGIEETYEYLKTTDNVHKKDLLKYIGETIDTCNYSQEEIDDWTNSKREYFNCYTYPITDELYFLYSTNEKDLFLEKLPEWINQNRKWSYEELSLFRTYAKYSGDKLLQIKASELTVEKNDKDFLDDINKKELATLYIECGQEDKALEILKSIIKSSDNKNIIGDCLEHLCKIVIKNKDNLADISSSALEIIEQQRKYGQFSPYVDELIKDVNRIMTDEKTTAHIGIANIEADVKIMSFLNSIKQWFSLKNKSKH
ncbi:MAG: hypothetical protein J7539_07075 [Niabella sp.]|nr:hypothetical protein [Niabella sp.]